MDWRLRGDRARFHVESSNCKVAARAHAVIRDPLVARFPNGPEPEDCPEAVSYVHVQVVPSRLHGRSKEKTKKNKARQYIHARMSKALSFYYILAEESYMFKKKIYQMNY